MANIDAWILEKLMRQAWMYWKGRVGEPYWNMHYAFRGHMVVLVDQGSRGAAVPTPGLPVPGERGRALTRGKR